MTHQAALAVAAILFATAGGLIGYLIAEAFNREERIALQLENIHARGSLDAANMNAGKWRKQCLELQAALHHRKIIEEVINGQAGKGSARRYAHADASHESHNAGEGAAGQRGHEEGHQDPRSTGSKEAFKV